MKVSEYFYSFPEEATSSSDESTDTFPGLKSSVVQPVSRSHSEIGSIANRRGHHDYASRGRNADHYQSSTWDSYSDFVYGDQM